MSGTNTKISFKHLTGQYKPIPGIDDADLSPRLVQKLKTHPEAGQKPFPEMELVPGHVVSIILVNEDYEDLSDADKKLPPNVVVKIEQDRANEMIMRRTANQSVRNVLQHYARSNDIEIIGETELDAQELLDSPYPIVSLSDIAKADYQDRGIEIPAKLQSNTDTERLRAKEVIAKKTAAEKKREREDAEMAALEAEEAEKIRLANLDK